MRKLLAILLLAVFILPLAPALLAATAPAESSLPACCRRTGLHHCSMRMAPSSGQPTLQAHCPFQQSSPFFAHSLSPLLIITLGLFASLLLAHPAGIPQTESRLRIARERSRHKRGPPAVPFLS